MTDNVIPPVVPKRSQAKLTADFIIEAGRLRILLPEWKDLPEDFRADFESLGRREEFRNNDHIVVDEIEWIFSTDWHWKHRKASGEIE